MKKFFNNLFVLILICMWSFWIYILATEGVVIFAFLTLIVGPLTFFFGGLAGITGGKKQ